MLTEIYGRIYASLYQFAFAKDFFDAFSESITGFRLSLLTIVAPVAALSIVLSGIIMLIPIFSDDNKKVAKNILLGVGIGLAIIALAPIIVETIMNIFTVEEAAGV